jgi:UDP-N-acetylglucosamine acyltransferase
MVTAPMMAPRGELDGLNLVGLKRRGVERSEITALRAAYQMLAQGEGTFLDRARRLADETDSTHVREVTGFILAASDRSFLTPK